MGQLVTTDALDKLVAEAAIGHSTVGVDGPLYQPSIGLFTNNPSLVKTTKDEDLVDPVYSGYAGHDTISWQGPIREDDGSYTIITESQLFQSASADPYVPDTVAGVKITDGDDPAVLLAFGELDEPYVFDVPDRGITVQVAINYSVNGVNCEVKVVS